MIIYKVTNRVNNKIYIGKTVRGLLKRRKEHEKSIVHNNICMPFHKALKKYGVENFDWEIIDSVITRQELCEKEKEWIKSLNSRDKNIGYNITEGGEDGDTISKHPNRDEIVRKISENNVYRKHPDKKLELSKKMSGKNNPMYGKNYQTKGLKKWARFRKNKKFEDVFSIEKANEIKIKISIGNKNKKITEEQRENYRLANLGEKNPFYKELPQEIINSILEEYSKTNIIKEIATKCHTTTYLVKKYLKKYNVLKT